MEILWKAGSLKKFKIWTFKLEERRVWCPNGESCNSLVNLINFDLDPLEKSGNKARSALHLSHRTSLNNRDAIFFCNSKIQLVASGLFSLCLICCCLYGVGDGSVIWLTGITDAQPALDSQLFTGITDAQPKKGYK